MYTKLLLLTTATFLLFTTGCSKNPPLQVKQKQDKIECKVYGETAPAWICKTPEKSGYYVATGFAKKSNWGFSFMRNNAVLDANTQIARQINVQIKNYITSYLSETGNNAAGDRAIEQYTKQIIYTTTLKNSKIEKMFFDKAGNMYVLVTVPKRKNLQEVKQKIRSTFNNKEALWQQFRAEQADKKLEEELKKGGENVLY